MTKLSELRVVEEGSSAWEPHSTRPAKREDVIAVVREMGGEDARFPHGIIDMEAALDPGNYLVLRLDDGEEE